MRISHVTIHSLADYSTHLKTLPLEDKVSRFGYNANDYAIDQLMLQMAYHPKDHEIWCANIGTEVVGWGHMARTGDDIWELAVSVDHKFQRKGIGNSLITEMLAWAKFHKVQEVFMHCIDENKVIQHLANKNSLTVRERGMGERTAVIEVPNPSLFETNSQLWKEQTEIMNEIAKLRSRLTDLWVLSISPKTLNE